MKAGLRRELFDLARLYGIQIGYRSASGKHVAPTPEGLVGVLKVLRAPIERMDDVSAALRERREELARRCLPPVHVVRDSQADRVHQSPGSPRSAPVARRISARHGAPAGDSQAGKSSHSGRDPGGLNAVTVPLRLTQRRRGSLEATLELEGGDTRHWRFSTSGLSPFR
ncbi:MAG: hypothetical protein HY682_06530, partial [Chloroflexi bacterium]|nr:hypothetical protein [Chloroflexota bacterium]